MRALTVLFLIISVATSARSSAALAEHDPGEGYSFDIPRTRSAISQRVAVTEFPLSNLSSDSQARVNQAIELSHGFWTFEAERQLREVIKQNPSHPMPYALAAMVQTIFESGDFERGDNYFAKAQETLTAYKESLTERERDWFSAIAELYNENLPTVPERRVAHVNKLQALSLKYPEDLEAKAFLALGNWLYKILPGNSPEAERQHLITSTDQLINEILAKSPRHPAHHYKIHLWNNGKDDFRALDSARASGPAQPQTAHLWHMPAHIFRNTLDRYYALRQVEVAHRVDHKQMLERRLMPSIVHNYYHNYRDFALGLKSGAGQIRDAISQAAGILKFGRLPTPTSRAAHSTLASGMLRYIEQYQHWGLLEDLVGGGYLDGLSTSDVILNQKYLSDVLRLRIRAMTATSQRFARHNSEAAVLLKQLENLANEAARAGEPGKPVMAAYEDARLWYEVAIRRPSRDVPEYFLTKLSGLKLTPASQLLLLAQELAHSEIAESTAQALLSDRKSLQITDHLNLLAYYLAPEYSASRDVGIISDLERAATLAITPPVAASDFEELKLAGLHPDLMKRIIENGISHHNARVANPPKELQYLEDINMDAMGPLTPQMYAWPEYRGQNQDAANVFATPSQGRYKLFVFAVGPACPLCVEQLKKLDAAKETLKGLGIDLYAVTLSGDPAFSIPTVGDQNRALHKGFGIWDEFSERPLHGVVFINERRQMLWDSVTEHAINDVDFLVEEFARLTKIQKNSKNQIGFKSLRIK